jgi:hypothetical protein
MELKKFSSELLSKMEMEIDQLMLDQPEVLTRFLQIISCIENNLYQLKHVVVEYHFKSEFEEIHFFKEVKPVVMSNLLLYKKLFDIHLFASYNDTDSRMRYYQRLLKSLQTFMSKHIEFYRYVSSGDQQFDKAYFTRSTRSIRSLELDERFSTRCDGTLAKILANEHLKDYLTKAIKKIKQGKASEDDTPPLTWTGSKTDLIELIYGLHASGVFNKSSSDLKQIATYFESVFNVSLGNYYRTFQEIRIRKGGQTNFLDQVREKLLSKIQEFDA